MFQKEYFPKDSLSRELFLKQTHLLAVGESLGAWVVDDGDIKNCFHGGFVKAGKCFSGKRCLHLRGGYNSETVFK